MQTGEIQVQLYTSRGKIPVSGATVLMIHQKELIALQLTGSSGKTQVVSIPTPSLEESQEAGASSPYAELDIWVEHPNFVSQTIHNVQVFPETLSLLPVELIPLSEEDSSLVEEVDVNLSSQNL